LLTDTYWNAIGGKVGPTVAFREGMMQKSRPLVTVSDTYFCSGTHLPLPILAASFFEQYSEHFHAYPDPALFYGGARLVVLASVDSSLC